MAYYFIAWYFKEKIRPNELMVLSSTASSIEKPTSVSE